MFLKQFTYSEDILQAIWKELWFDVSGLQTTDGKGVKILHPGVQNLSDGPDFLNAKICIDSITFVGAIELHIANKSWYEHGHHVDLNYEKVVLHVVADLGGGAPVQTKLGGQVPTLNLLPHFSDDLTDFLAAYSQPSGLPCTSQGVNFISEVAFLAQFEKAHQEYLDKKVDDFYAFFDATLTPSVAWKYALITALFDGFGISKNRSQMRQVAELLINEHQEMNMLDTGELWQQIRIAENSRTLVWNTKGVRPNHQPTNRLPALFTLADHILSRPLNEFLSLKYANCWQTLLAEAGIKGKHIQILYGIVFLPAIYALASMLEHKSLKTNVWNEWSELRSPVPSSLLSAFTGLPKNVQDKVFDKLGAVHQLKTYCSARRCEQCEVLKKAISS